MICKKKQELLAKTGSWFHGKDTNITDPVREIQFGLNTPPSHSPSHNQVESNNPKKSSLSPLFSRRKKPGTEEPFNGKSQAISVYQKHPGIEATRPILVRAKSLDSKQIIASRNQDDKSDSSDISSESQSKKKTVTFGKDDLIQTHTEYIENIERMNGVGANTLNDPAKASDNIQVTYFF